MVPTPHRRAITVILCAAALVAVSGCGGGGDAGTSTPTTSTTPAASAGGQTYSSKASVLPLTVTVDAGLKSPPNPDSPNLLSSDATASDENKVRFLVPVELYRPGSSTPEAPPKDYLTYLQGQPKEGAELSKVTKISVDGHPATLMNLLRLAVVDVGETTLLAWARMNTDNPDPAFAAMFEQMLTTVRFR
jgi:hypothetical protein